MYVGYSDIGKSTTTDKIRTALAECWRNHNCIPIEIQCNADDMGALKDVDGIPLVVTGKLIAERGIFFFKLPTVVE